MAKSVDQQYPSRPVPFPLCVKLDSLSRFAVLMRLHPHYLFDTGRLSSVEDDTDLVFLRGRRKTIQCPVGINLDQDKGASHGGIHL